MDKLTFTDLTRENPEDMFGGDWQNEIDELLDVNENEYCSKCHKKLNDKEYTEDAIYCDSCQKTRDIELVKMLVDTGKYTVETARQYLGL